ncbi:FAD:protein FMN transferase [Dongshaea marina]|uniref:FAD:protein FMN transferase n=1 Tax=Dongshaea marina TaxID=2047966 RepID=UPI000D3EB77E|nr:FAD:protein FMN transferase [Dongshaea marina]
MVSVVIRWLALSGLAILLTACQGQAKKEIAISGQTMGTFYSIKVTGDGIKDPDKFKAKVDALLDEVNQQMSTFIPDSELSRFNSSKQTKPFAVSVDTARVVTRAIQIGRMTRGALDVTVGPLVNLWGFGPDKRPTQVPSEALIERTRKRVGLGFLHVTTSVEGQYLQKDIPGLYVDLSAIAKGFGVDKVADYIESLGIDNYLVDIGGEVRANGVNGKGTKWRVAIEKPAKRWGTVQEVLQIGDNAIATSGDYRNFYKLDGKTFAHEINPLTGKPEVNKILSVSVVTPSCMDADGYATAFMVMGAKRTLAFAKKHNLAVFVIERTKDGVRESYSQAFKKYIVSRG